MSNPNAQGRLRVVIATDGSDASCAGADAASRLLPADADFSIVTVIDPELDPMADAGGFEGPVMGEKEAHDRYRESVVAAEGALAASARAFGSRPLHQEVLERSHGSVADRICAYADEVGADIIVVGSHGHGALADVLLGSVTSALLHHCPCPVLVIPRDRHAS